MFFQLLFLIKSLIIQLNSSNLEHCFNFFPKHICLTKIYVLGNSFAKLQKYLFLNLCLFIFTNYVVSSLDYMILHCMVLHKNIKMTSITSWNWSWQYNLKTWQYREIKAINLQHNNPSCFGEDVHPKQRLDNWTL